MGRGRDHINDMSQQELQHYDPARYGRDRERVEDGFWRKLRRVAGRIPFAEDLLTAYYCAVDPGTPLQVKAILMGALAYFVLPTDLVPDFFALAGYGDDAAVLAAAIRSVLHHVKPAHRRQAAAALARVEGKDRI